MPTKKSARAKQKRRHEQFEAKLAARMVRRRRRQRVASAIAVAALALGGGTITVMTMTSPTDDPNPIRSVPASDQGIDPSPGVNYLIPSTRSPLVAPPEGYAEGREWVGSIELDQGTLSLTLDGANAPIATGSFVYLAQLGYFDEVYCHRLTTEGIYVLQCGSPDGTGMDGPGYNFGPVENAPTDSFYPAGTIAMARTSDPNSMGSQFFIVYQDSYIAMGDPNGYTVFGAVTEGLGIVEAIAAAGTVTDSPDGLPAEPVVLREVSVS